MKVKIMKQIVEIKIVNNFLHSRYMAIDALGDSVLENEKFFPKSVEGMDDLYKWSQKQDVNNGSDLILISK